MDTRTKEQKCTCDAGWFHRFSCPEFGGRPPYPESLADVKRTSNPLSAVERLHNICNALSEQLAESPFTREEWDRIDAENVTMRRLLREWIAFSDARAYCPSPYRETRAFVGAADGDTDDAG